MLPSLLVSVLAACIAALTLAYTVHRAGRTDTSDLADRLARLETKVEVFWRQVSFTAAQALHSPHPEHARRDWLLEGYMAGKLAPEEMGELVRELERVQAKHDASTAEVLAAGILLHSIQQRYVDLEI